MSAIIRSIQPRFWGWGPNNDIVRKSPPDAAYPPHPPPPTSRPTPPQINSAENLQSLLERGALCRTTASTNMNAHSSRSHAICTLSFEMVRPATEETEETVTSSQFHLVDLAGSERAKKTGAEVRRRAAGWPAPGGEGVAGGGVCAVFSGVC